MKDIPNYEGLYAATEDGRIYSYRSKRFLIPNKTQKGYLHTTLTKNGKAKTYKIHRLIAETYIPNPNGLPQVNHIDEDKTNNCINNLEWCDSKYNINFGTRNEKSAKARRKKIQCVETNEIFNSLTEAAKNKNINIGHISECIHGRRHTCGGYHWKECLE